MSTFAISNLFKRNNPINAIQHIQQQKSLNPKIHTSVPEDTFEFSENKTGYTGWVEIPSKNHDNKNFSSNLQMLNFLWNYKWDKPYYTGYGQNLEKALNENDFHIYYESGKPVMAVALDNAKRPVQIYGLDSLEDSKKYSPIMKEQINNSKNTDYSLFY